MTARSPGAASVIVLSSVFLYRGSLPARLRRAPRRIDPRRDTAGRWPVRIESSPAARAYARQYMDDQDGMCVIGAAVSALAADPNPPDAQ